MEDEEHPAFPYTDAFRRAKRNSLIWSGITVAAALGSPPVIGGEATLGQLGLSLTYDKSVLIGISGTVAIFMGAGFFQAYQRIRLHASQLFSGKSDVAVIFSELSKRASQSIRAIDGAVNVFRKQVTDDASGVFFDVRDTLKDLLNVQREEVAEDERLMRRSKDWMRMESLSDQEVLNALPAVRAHLAGRGKRIEEIENKAFLLTEKIERAQREAVIAIGNAALEEKQAVDAQVHGLAATVSTLTRFHDGIYRSEKIWFWTYDVVPVVGLFAAAIIPYVRLFVA